MAESRKEIIHIKQNPVFYEKQKPSAFCFVPLFPHLHPNYTSKPELKTNIQNRAIALALCPNGYHFKKLKIDEDHCQVQRYRLGNLQLFKTFAYSENVLKVDVMEVG
ncbi:hypothetical protein [Psychroflexus sp. MES1-P1E]|uniref:hypothetical protein n=1 Tax=Psychroflexus sp. MES1-P1E TaxID=2058320 RepID=UPI000C7B40D8|nr:hypothetical protein [Psychroflexus sp. MES1-P1E]PKG44061.1 hypothetical protein CXF67_01570 [Psychroflexus sp. MES1-P1E]